MTYIPHTPEDQAAMLEAVGIDSGRLDDLFRSIPPELRARSFDLPSGQSEFEVMKELTDVARKNTLNVVTFLGGGFYDHYIPAPVDALAGRSEFYTAYTPYQPEASQGTLQAIYEYQSCICRLTDMEVSNASVYDGGTALYEAAMMARRATGRRKILMDGGVNPIYRTMVRSYTSNLSIEFVETPVVHGQTDREAIEKHLDDETAAVIVQNPNFFGVIDDHSDIAEMCRRHGALSIQSVYPISLGILKSPGEMGIDIATGEGQSLGIPLSFGGPYLGFMATSKTLARKMPGRIVGATIDAQERRGFVLTLQAREQHIRREKATSNICSNEALCALRALIYLCLLGREGIKQVARLCLAKAEYARQRLEAIPGVEVKRSSPTFNEFTVVLPRNAEWVIGEMMERGIAAGFPLSRYYPGMEHYMLVAVTEKRTKQEIAMYAAHLEDVLWS
ncbi:aminomethyl-transferring glycine dehydrogenase subunit GcvPA [Candidatus Sumerlaeota bacterium]|nr:aminomethyl-transferring glycine dehydrogenase subunit GcvPA [Candidatus Sumerlaeota bacterium]